MHDGTFHISGAARTLFLSVTLAVLFFLSVSSIRTLMGAYYYGKVPGILDDQSSEESVTIMELSADTAPAYGEAIGVLTRAAFFDPSRALYQKAIADISTRLGSWAETMELLQASLPGETLSSSAEFERAATNIREAIMLQPTNSDHHLAYGHLAQTTKNIDIARIEYERTANAYPVNAAIRFAVAMGYLTAGQRDDALEQAKMLARIDESYLLPETAAKQSILDRRSPFYVKRLAGSYLFKAFEIIWITSNKDMNMVRESVPGNDEAGDAFELFVDLKSVEVK